MAYNWNNPVDFSSGFGADTQGQFKDITSFLPTKQGGNMLLAPLAAPLTGLFSAGSSMFGANKAEEAARRSDNTSKQIAQAQLDAQRAGIEDSRNLAKGNLGFGIFDKVFSAGTGADLDFGRNKTAALFQRSTLDPMDTANKLASARGEIGLRGSSEAKALEQAANRENLKRTLAEKQGQMMGMVGRIAPVDTSTLFV